MCYYRLSRSMADPNCPGMRRRIVRCTRCTPLCCCCFELAIVFNCLVTTVFFVCFSVDWFGLLFFGELNRVWVPCVYAARAWWRSTNTASVARARRYTCQPRPHLNVRVGVVIGPGLTENGHSSLSLVSPLCVSLTATRVSSTVNFSICVCESSRLGHLHSMFGGCALPLRLGALHN